MLKYVPGQFQPKTMACLKIKTSEGWLFLLIFERFIFFSER